MQLLHNIKTLIQCRLEGTQNEIFPIEDAALVWDQGRIEWVGAAADLPLMYKSARAFDAQGALVIPGLIDCHTHLAFGGNRADEFEMRCLGKTYLETAKSGGGILSTVRATRESSEEQLYQKASYYLQRIKALGVTTLECKSGYGLNLEDELKILRVYNKLNREQELTLIPTLLAAHTFPAEFRDNRQGYIKLLIESIIPEVAQKKLANFCDIFVEDSAFTCEEARKILKAARDSGFKLKLHADQLSQGSGAELAVELEAVSADHLEHISDAGIRAMASSKVVAVSLPIASLYTREAPLDARRLIEKGISVAVASDFNPGSAPSYHLPFAMMLACTLNRMTPAEALKGATILAAKALGLDHQVGSIEPGKNADFALIQAPSINHWLYLFEANSCIATVKDGEMIYDSLS